MENEIKKEAMNEAIKEATEHTHPHEPAKQKMRQIIIETDGNNITISKAEVAGNLELIAILSALLNKISTK